MAATVGFRWGMTIRQPTIHLSVAAILPKGTQAGAIPSPTGGAPPMADGHSQGADRNPTARRINTTGKFSVALMRMIPIRGGSR